MSAIWCWIAGNMPDSLSGWAVLLVGFAGAVGISVIELLRFCFSQPAISAILDDAHMEMTVMLRPVGPVRHFFHLDRNPAEDFSMMYIITPIDGGNDARNRDAVFYNQQTKERIGTSTRLTTARRVYFKISSGLELGSYEVDFIASWHGGGVTWTRTLTSRVDGIYWDGPRHVWMNPN